MKTIIYDENVKAVATTNPFAVRIAYDADDSFSATYSSPDIRTAQTIKAATSGSSIYITDLIISTGTAMNIQLQDGDATVMMYPVYLSANVPFEKTFSTPLKITASKALAIKGSAYGTVTCTFGGYVA